MIRILFALIYLGSPCFLLSQVSVHGAKELLKKMESRTLYINGKDTASRRLYLSVLNKEFPFDTIVFLNDENFMENLVLDNFYLSPIKVKVFNSNGFARNFTTLILFRASKSIIHVMKKRKDLAFSTINPSITFALEPKEYGWIKRYEDGALKNSKLLERYNFGVFKNNIQQVKNACEKGKDIAFFKDYADKEKLSVLKQDTLFVVQDSTEGNYLPDLFRNHYPYKYKFISNVTLEDFILKSNKDFYYLHFDYAQMRMANQISIVNSLSGNQIFHDQSLTVNLLSERMLKMIIEKIEAK